MVNHFVQNNVLIELICTDEVQKNPALRSVSILAAPQCCYSWSRESEPLPVICFTSKEKGGRITPLSDLQSLCAMVYTMGRIAVAVTQGHFSAVNSIDLPHCFTHRECHLASYMLAVEDK